MFKLGITLGDINGIGAEIALKTVYSVKWPDDLQFVLIGPQAALAAQASAFGFEMPPTCRPDSPPLRGRVHAWDPKPEINPDWMPGRIDSAASRAAEAAIAGAAGACVRGEIDGMVTAPISKEGFKLAGFEAPGHTELIARLTGTERFAMMLAGGGLRVVLVTRHLPLKDVSEHLFQTAVEDAIELAAEGLPWLGVPTARIGVCGINPHAGDGGALGSEERDVITPAILSARSRGIDVDDVIPADVIFYRALRGRYDAVVAMYHDQGLGPLKMIAFDEGINITLGLPILRTSPDHGTAFDIAGKGVASPNSMIEATKLANILTRRQNPWISIAQHNRRA